MKAYRIGVLPGDGIGEEVLREGMRVISALSQKFGFRYEAIHYPFGAEHFLKTGEIIPDPAFAEMKTLDAIYLGAIGDPRIETGKLERGIVGRLRWELDLYVNLRPVRLYAEHLCPLKDTKPEDLDILVVRENTEGIYLGIGGFMRKGTEHEIATQETIYTRRGVERIIRYAFDACRKRNKKRKITLVDKANAVGAHDLWRRTFAEVAKEYPDLTTEANYVDATCMWMVKNPESFDTIVTENMFGDIITDLGAMLQGGMGVAAGGNIHPGKVSMFEPIHGSAPKHKGKNVANPIAAILAGGMMLDHLGEHKAAATVENAAIKLLNSGKLPSLGTDSGVSTQKVGDLMLEAL